MRRCSSYPVATAGRFTSGAGTVPTCLASTGSSLSQSLPPLRFLERYFNAPHSPRPKRSMASVLACFHHVASKKRLSPALKRPNQ
jgi:hypothetical protein